ncbi:hypothetical protein LTS10_012007 [Elasticomyces elasticus]|nr:hypothetical protein LTS10_012007 [Elasticomyces elasticus]
MTGTNNMSNKRKRGVPAAEDQDNGRQKNANEAGHHAPKLRKVKTSTSKQASSQTPLKAEDTNTAASGPEPALRRSSRATDKYATAKGGTAIARSSGPKSLATAAKPGPVRTKSNKSTSSSSGVQAAPKSEGSNASSDDGIITVLAKRSEPPKEPDADESDGDDVITNEIDDDSDTIVVAMRPRNSVKKNASSSFRPGTFELRKAQSSSVADGTTQQVEDPAESKYRNMRRTHESGLSSFKKWQGGGSYRENARTTTFLMTVPSTSTVQSSSGVAAESATVEQGAQLPQRSSRFKKAQHNTIPIDAGSPTPSSIQARPARKSNAVQPLSKATNRQRATPTRAKSVKAPATPTAPARPRNPLSRTGEKLLAASGASTTLPTPTSLPLITALADELSETSETSSDESVSTASSPKPLPRRPYMGPLSDQFGLRRVEYERHQQARSDLGESPQGRSLEAETIDVFMLHAFDGNVA